MLVSQSGDQKKNTVGTTNASGKIQCISSSQRASALLKALYLTIADHAFKNFASEVIACYRHSLTGHFFRQSGGPGQKIGGSGSMTLRRRVSPVLPFGWPADLGQQRTLTLDVWLCVAAF
jgi:hypothetical protein